MTQPSGNLEKLVELAHERSSDKRRELLRDMSELFASTSEPPPSSSALNTADDILTTLAADMEASVRAELAERFADHGAAPERLVNDLARDVVEIARPLLERSTALSDDTLVAAVGAHGAEHAQIVAARPTVSAAVSDAVIATKHDGALVALARNDGAQLSRQGLEDLVEHAETCTELQAPLVERSELPPDLLNDMFFFVEDKIRERVLERNEEFSEDALNEAITAARSRMARAPLTLPSDYEDAVRFVQGRKLRKKLDVALLTSLLLEHQMTKFTIAFGELCGLPYQSARRITNNPSIEPLAIACRAAEFSRDDFLRIATLRRTSGERAGFDVDELGQVYEDLPQSVADRVMRFVKLRELNSDAA